MKAANPAITSLGNLKVFKGAYADGDRLEMFEGGFVNNTGAAALVTFPIVGSLTGGRRPTPSYDISGDEWVTPLVLNVNGFENSFGGVGMNSEASVGIDNYDDFNPPRFIEYAEISFSHPEHFLKHSTRDIVPTQSEYNWDFTVESNLSGAAELTWDNSRFGSNQKDLFLHDLKKGILIDMRQQGSYAFDPKKSPFFKIYFGENIKSKIKPQAITLGEASPNPSKGNVTIPFALSSTDASYNVLLEIYDLTGRKAGTLIEGTFKPGFYSAQWIFGDSHSNEIGRAHV